MKQCLRCRRILDESCFGMDTTRIDGLHRYCKDCRREQYRLRSGKGRERLLSYTTEALLWALRQKGVEIKITKRAKNGTK